MDTVGAERQTAAVGDIKSADERAWGNGDHPELGRRCVLAPLVPDTDDVSPHAQRRPGASQGRSDADDRTAL